MDDLSSLGFLMKPVHLTFEGDQIHDQKEATEKGEERDAFCPPIQGGEEPSGGRDERSLNQRKKSSAGICSEG